MYKISYICDGISSEFIFAFPFFQESDIRVALNGLLLDKNQYNIIATDSMDGGTVNFAIPPSEHVQLDIFRQVDLSRIVDYQPTVKIDPEDLNTDFNLLLEALKDRDAISLDIIEWKNIHDNVLSLIEYTKDVIEDKLSGGGILGIYRNLISVLNDAMPKLINDYGSVSEPAQNENSDDYGML